MSHMDGLSRLPLAKVLEIEDEFTQLNTMSSSSIIDIELVKQFQKSDSILHKVYINVKYGWSNNVN